MSFGIDGKKDVSLIVDGSKPRDCHGIGMMITQSWSFGCSQQTNRISIQQTRQLLFLSNMSKRGGGDGRGQIRGRRPFVVGFLHNFCNWAPIGMKIGAK